MGAIASGGARVMNPDVVDRFHLDPRLVERVVRQELAELARREVLYRGSRPPHLLRHRSLIVVDDGLATGSSMRAAVMALRAHAPKQIIIAVPVAAPEACSDLGAESDDIVCATTPEPFTSVGGWYDDFEQTSDEEVQQLLGEAQRFAPNEARRQALGAPVHLSRS